MQLEVLPTRDNPRKALKSNESINCLLVRKSFRCSGRPGRRETYSSAKAKKNGIDCDLPQNKSSETKNTRTKNSAVHESF